MRAHLTFAVGFFALILSLALCSERAPAAGMLCGPWELVQKQFGDRHGEVVVSGGLINAGTVVQVLASPDGATFSVFVVDRTLVACLILEGKGWEPGKLPISRVEGDDT